MLTTLTGVAYLATTTRCGTQQLTAAATKEALAKTALTLGDAYATYKTLGDEMPTHTRLAGGTYLAARVLDILVNFGGVSKALVQCDSQSLLSNIRH